MYGEMYVVHLVETSERAQAVASRFLAGVGPSAQLKEMRDPGFVSRIAEAEKWPENEVFSWLAGEIKKAFEQQPLPRLTRDHLNRLPTRDSRLHLSQLLACDFNDVVATLFDPVRMKQTLEKVNPTEAQRSPLDADALLYRILTDRDATALEEMVYSGAADVWSMIIREEKWLKVGPIEDLKERAAERGWSQTDVTRVLAACIDGASSNQPRVESYHGKLLDAPGLMYLRRRIQWVIILLQEEALERATEAAQLAPHQPSVVRLRPWLELYERGAVARALPYVFAQKRPLAHFVSRDKCEVPDLSFRPDPTRHLSVQDAIAYERGYLPRRTLGSFAVHCARRGEEHGELILRCHDIREEIFNELTMAIPKLTGDDLSAAGDSVGECLLNTPVLLPDPVARRFRGAVERLGAAFAQCAVLCGIPLPIQMDAPWCEELGNELPYKPLETEKDTKFTHDVHAIVEDLREGYERAGKTVVIVTDADQE